MSTGYSGPTQGGGYDYAEIHHNAPEVVMADDRHANAPEVHLSLVVNERLSLVVNEHGRHVFNINDRHLNVHGSLGRANIRYPRHSHTLE
ncbi:uncharacterized protein J7T54_005872 [Emericellopsis cladophorae]|uniref:Uncharacterized protein n=1 Tax=Emericellopsis cladophorae TaxID=2686198 RepID=A0A9P9XUC8_9HYPO|nr:uncharacterized protein J7T54_005872 [Emericellopsis cladophorae]KAI6777723.1 hypothetical protein J7T54_005872 [Emericellopsis cladophorae]